MANRKRISPFGDVNYQEQLVKNATVKADQYVVREILVDDIKINPKNKSFRKYDTESSIKELADSIPEAHDLRNPIHVKRINSNENEGKKYLLISGERRTRAFMLNGFRRIPAFIDNEKSEIESEIDLFLENLQIRHLTNEQLFSAFVELETLLKKAKTDIKNKDLNDYISRVLSISTRSVERMRALQKHAAEEDIELLSEGKISYEEFKNRTSQLVAEIERQQSEINQRKYIISQNVKDTRYVDVHNTVYYVDSNSDGKYAIHLMGYGIKPMSIVTVSCPLRKEKRQAQADLDTYAAANDWTEYKGDMSEFEEKPVNDEKPITAAPTENSNTDGNTPLEPVSSKLGKDDVSDDTSDFPTEQESESESVGTTPAVETATTDTNHLENREINSQNDSHEDEHDNSIETDSALETEDRIEGQISDFVGINRSGQSIRGSLCTSNDKVFIIHNISFGDEIGDGKYNIRCIAEEVDKNTVQRYDI